MESLASPSRLRPTAHESVVLQGTFDDFTLEQVLHVVGLSRQCLRLTLERGSAHLGELVIKSAQILQAQVGAESDPARALAALARKALRGEGVSFVIRHVVLPGALPPSLGSLESAWRRAAALSSRHEVATADALPKPASTSGRAAPLASSGDAISAAGTPRTEDLELRARLERMEALLQQALAAPAASSEAVERLQQSAEQLHRKADTLDGKLQLLPQLLIAEVKVALSGAGSGGAPAGLLWAILALQIAILVVGGLLWAGMR